MKAHEARLEVGARSETGYVRDENQDRMSGTQVPLGQLYIVADGMGGHKGGALAAELTVQGLQQHLSKAPAHMSVEEAIQTAFQLTNQTVYEQAHSGDPTTENMGSTAVLLLISDHVASVAHAGDSRAYLYRQGRLTQLTTDHTIVQKMVQAGILKPEEAIDHPNANVLERAIGSEQSIEVEISDPLPLNDGDAILLCSDGLSSYVTEAEIVSVLRSRATVQEVAERLVNLALAKGGEDNVTVQFIQHGTRKEAQSRKTAPMNMLTPWQRRRHMVTTFVLGTGLSAAAFYGYWHLQVSPQFQAAEYALQTTEDKAEQLKGQLAALKQAARTEASKLQQELESTKSAQTTSERNIRALQEQLTQTRRTAQANAENLQQQLATTKANAENLQQQLATTKANADNLQQRLTVAETQLGELEAKLAQATAERDALQTALQKALQAAEAQKASQPTQATEPVKP